MGCAPPGGRAFFQRSDVAAPVGREAAEVVAAAHNQLEAVAPPPHKSGRRADDRRRLVRDALGAAPLIARGRRLGQTTRVPDKITIGAGHDAAAVSTYLAERVVRVRPERLFVLGARARDPRNLRAQLAGAELRPVLAPERADAGGAAPAAAAPPRRIFYRQVLGHRAQKLPGQLFEGPAADGRRRRLAASGFRARGGHLRLALRRLLLFRARRRRVLRRVLWRGRGRLAGLAAQAQGEAERGHFSFDSAPS